MTFESTISLILGRWVVPVQIDASYINPISTIHESDVVISHGAVAICNNIIIGVGKMDDIKNQFASGNTQIVDLSRNHILIPGEKTGITILIIL